MFRMSRNGYILHAIAGNASGVKRMSQFRANTPQSQNVLPILSLAWGGVWGGGGTERESGKEVSMYLSLGGGGNCFLNFIFSMKR